jgi:hypothetical protein
MSRKGNPCGPSSQYMDTPQVLLDHHLKTLRGFPQMEGGWRINPMSQTGSRFYVQTVPPSGAKYHQAKVVELRYFGGLSEEDIAEALRISPRTVRRDWDSRSRG